MEQDVIDRLMESSKRYVIYDNKISEDGRLMLDAAAMIKKLVKERDDLLNSLLKIEFHVSETLKNVY